MENKMILKVYDIDYSFIIKNYLDTKLWEKEWTLFVYKKFIVTLRLTHIYTFSKKIYFEIKVTDNNSKSWNRSTTESVEYSLNVDNINILKKSINKAILNAMKEIELKLYIINTDEYDELLELQEKERDRLTDIANDFLDENDITNEDIREAYIDAYVDNNETIWKMKKDYEYENIYKMIPDLYLTFARATNNKDLEEEILVKNAEKKEELLKQLKEFEEYLETEDFENDARDNLEEV